MAEHNDIGKAGEEIAAKFLTSKGYKIRNRNWTGAGTKLELDIVAEKDGELIFVEVKTRTSTLLGQPEMAVTPSKMNNITKGANHYIQIYEIEDLDPRFDIISIVYNKEQPEKSIINHIEGAFVPRPRYH